MKKIWKNLHRSSGRESAPPARFSLSRLTSAATKYFDLAFVLVCAACLPLAGCDLVHVAGSNHQPQFVQPNQHISPVATVSPAAQAARSVSRWLFVAAGVCLLGCGALAYFGQVFPAIKLGLAGITLPIFAAWFSVHWGIVIAAILVLLALYVMIYNHKFVTPLEKRIVELEKRFA
jgi:hypothetical protein